MSNANARDTEQPRCGSCDHWARIGGMCYGACDNPLSSTYHGHSGWGAPPSLTYDLHYCEKFKPIVEATGYDKRTSRSLRT